MDAVNGERGQALVLAVIAIALAAVTIVGMRAAQERILSDVRERRAGEAAVEAAGAAVADAQLAFIASLGDDLGGRRARATRSELEAFVADPLVAERARAAAADLSASNGGSPVHDLAIDLSDRMIEIVLTAGAHRQRAAIDAPCCRR